MRFAAHLSEIPCDTRNLLGIETSAFYAQASAQLPSSQDFEGSQSEPSQEQPMAKEQVCVKRKADGLEEVASKRARSDQPDLEGHYWAVQMAVMRP
uniref:Uncharacterized protein n=1 Tax=Steinernema glaseri TaxID=37863 RepID=A0A1I8A821_9BILA